jgi:hypothetical protein
MTASSRPSPAPAHHRLGLDALLGLHDALAAAGVPRDEADAMPLRSVSALGATARTRRYATPTVDGVEVDRESDVMLVRARGALLALSLHARDRYAVVREGATVVVLLESRHDADRAPADWRAAPVALG